MIKLVITTAKVSYLVEGTGAIVTVAVPSI